MTARTAKNEQTSLPKRVQFTAHGKSFRTTDGVRLVYVDHGSLGPPMPPHVGQLLTEVGGLIDFPEGAVLPTDGRSLRRRLARRRSDGQCAVLGSHRPLPAVIPLEGMQWFAQSLPSMERTRGLPPGTSRFPPAVPAVVVTLMGCTRRPCGGMLGIRAAGGLTRKAPSIEGAFLVMAGQTLWLRSTSVRPAPNCYWLQCLARWR